MQDCSHPSADGLELLQSCTEPSDIMYMFGYRVGMGDPQSTKNMVSLWSVGIGVSWINAVSYLLSGCSGCKTVLAPVHKRWSYCSHVLSNQCAMSISSLWFAYIDVWWLKGNGYKYNLISVALCKTVVTPVLMHWSYCSLALSHRYHVYLWIHSGRWGIHSVPEIWPVYDLWVLL